MNLTCPACFARFQLDAALNDTSARHAIAIALELPGELGPLLLRYLGCFNPPQRAASWSRINRLLNELNAAINAGKIRRHGRDWHTTTPIWHQALTTLLARKDTGKLNLPLDDHNYLYAITADLADKAEGVQEKTAEANLINRRTTAGATTSKTTSNPIDHAQQLINSPAYIKKMNQELGLD